MQRSWQRLLFGRAPKSLALRLTYLKANMSDLQLVMDWRDERKSPPRCLSCGGTEISHAGSIGHAEASYRLAFAHPGCGGELVVSTPPIRINMRTDDIVFDAEGQLIEVRPQRRPTLKDISRFLDY